MNKSSKTPTNKTVKTVSKKVPSKRTPSKKVLSKKTPPKTTYQRNVPKKITVRAYSQNGQSIIFDTVTQAAKALGIGRGTVVTTARTGGYYKIRSGAHRGKKVRFELSPVENFSQYEPIHAYDLDGSFVKSFKTVVDAANELNGSASVISTSIPKNRSYHAYGFLWFVQKHESVPSHDVLKNSSRTGVVKSKDGKTQFSWNKNGKLEFLKGPILQEQAPQEEAVEEPILEKELIEKELVEDSGTSSSHCEECHSSQTSIEKWLSSIDKKLNPITTLLEVINTTTLKAHALELQREADKLENHEASEAEKKKNTSEEKDLLSNKNILMALYAIAFILILVSLAF